MFASRRLWLGLIVSAAFVVLFFLTVDEVEMAKALSTADYRYLIPAILLYFLTIYFRAIRWKYILSPIQHISNSRLIPVIIVGYTANNLLPARLGEVARAYYLGHREKFSVSTSLATILVERIYDGLTLIVLGIIGTIFILFTGLIGDFTGTTALAWGLGVTVTVFLFVLSIIILTLISIFPNLARFIIKLANVLPSRFRPLIQSTIMSFIDGLLTLRHPRQHVALFVYSLPIWILEALMYFIIAVSFDIPSFFESPLLLIPPILLVIAVSNLATALPSSPGAIGTFEFPAAATLTLVGITPGIAGAYTLTLHLALLIPITIVGICHLWLGNIPLSKLMSRQ